MLVRVEHHPSGARLHVGGRRIHHAHSGLLLVIAGLRLIYRDRRDYPWR